MEMLDIKYRLPVRLFSLMLRLVKLHLETNAFANAIPAASDRLLSEISSEAKAQWFDFSECAIVMAAASPIRL